MIWTIAKKEMLLHLTRSRFVVCVAVSVIILIPATLVRMDDYRSRLSAYQASVSAHRKQLSSTPAYSQLEVKLDRPPAAMGIFCRGIEPDLGMTTTLSIQSIPWKLDPPEATGGADEDPKQNWMSRWLMNRIGGMVSNIASVRVGQWYVDLTLVVALILSITALFVSFDVISGEREEGTLRLVLAEPVARLTVFSAKFIGVMAVLGLALVVAFGAALAVVTLSGDVALRGQDWLTLISLFAASVIYLSVFALIGMLTSTRCEKSGTALVLSFAAWALLVPLMPALAGHAARGWVEVPSVRMIDEAAAKEKDLVWAEIAKYAKEHPQPKDAVLKNASWEFWQGQPPPLAVWSANRVALDWCAAALSVYVPLKLNMAQRIWERAEVRREAVAGRNRLGRMLSIVWPAGAFRQLSARIAGTDEQPRTAFLAVARRYREALLEEMRQRRILDTEKYFMAAPGTSFGPAPASSNVPAAPRAVDVSWAPGFEPPRRSAAEAIPWALPEFLSLLAWACVLFAVGGAAFTRGE